MLLLPWLRLQAQAEMKNLKTPSDGVGFLFLVLVVGQFCPAHFPSHSVMMPKMHPLPFEEPVLEVQKHLSAKMLASTGWKPSDLLCLEKT